MTVLPVCYDLARSPPTYDFVSFLVGAEQARLAGGHDALDVHILPGPADGFRADRLPPQDPAHRRALLAGVVEPMARLLPSVRTVITHGSRPATPPGDYGWCKARYGFPLKVEAARLGIYPFQAPPMDLSLPVPAGARYVTITLRECPWWPTRNSNIAEWLVIAIHLERRGLTPIFVRDTAASCDMPPPWITWPAASLNLYCRARLYADATLNLFVNNGPAWLAWFMGAPALICKMTSEGAPCVSQEFFASAGLQPGSNMPNARPRQRLLWADDQADVVLAAVDELLAT